MSVTGLSCDRLPQGWEDMVKSPPPGGMTERLKVTVLKTVVAQATVGSNPTPSAVLRIVD